MSHLLRIGRIQSLSTDDKVFRRGQQYYNDGNVADMRIEERDEDGGNVVFAKVEGSAGRVYSVSLMFGRQGMLQSYGCNCDAASIWKGACKHVVAAMLMLQNRSSAKIEQVYSDRIKTAIINHFKAKLVSSIDSDFARIHDSGHKRASLVPTMHVESGRHGAERCSLSFGVGYSRLYVVRNVKALVMHVRSGAEVRYGKGLQFKHDLHAFDEDSAKLLGALTRFYDSINELEKINRYAHRLVEHGPENRFVMPAWFVDEFFGIYGESGFHVCFPGLRDAEFVAMPIDAQGVIGFEVTDTGEELSLKQVADKCAVLEGERADYVLTGKGFARMSKSASADFTSLRGSMVKLHTNSLLLRDAQADHFRAYVVPQLRRTGLIVNDAMSSGEEQTAAYAVTPGVCRAKFYLDAPGKGESITFRAEFEAADGTVTKLPGENPPATSASLAAEESSIEGYEQLWTRAFLRNYGFLEDPSAAHYSLYADEQMFNFYLSGVQTAAAMGDVYATDAFRRREIQRPSKPAPHVRINGGLLEIDLQLEGYSIKELAEAVASYKLAKKYHRLRSGRFIDLGDENVGMAVKLLAGADVSKKDAERGKVVAPLYRVLEMDEELGGADVVRDEAIDTLIADMRSFGNADAGAALPVPPSLDTTMREYQKTGLRWLSTLARYGFGGILADEMGLGKTLQMISMLLAHKREHGGIRALVVAPTSLIYNWEHEIHKFAPELSAVVIAGTPQRRKELIAEHDNSNVMITTYDTLKRDIDTYAYTNFDYIVADEAQYMKNPATQNSSAVKAVNGRVRFALTGTPIENSVSELWSIFDFVMPGFLYSQTKFNKVYAGPITKDADESAGARLRGQVAPFILRRRKADVLSELPEKVETVQYSIMTEQQRLLYNAKLLEAQGVFESAVAGGSFETSKLDILSHITRLRQICAHPSLFIENYGGGSGKLSDLMETIQQTIDNGHRILLFSQFASMLKLIREALTREGISFFYLDGATEATLRKTMADRFNGGDKSIFLISLRAGGLGLNLTGADIVLHYDQWWNPAVMNQASDRAHRLGQTRTVQVINLIMKDSIEEKILKLQERKKALTDMVVSEGANFINKLSIEDVRELFKA
ncbi:MAG: DEAD/DEAH box helicase [Defluviitaleaceae bacterium]|nr:DEAD/DEAH box helicase [Defluviitaleaceae bacterium]